MSGFVQKVSRIGAKLGQHDSRQLHTVVRSFVQAWEKVSCKWSARSPMPKSINRNCISLSLYVYITYIYIFCYL